MMTYLLCVVVKFHDDIIETAIHIVTVLVYGKVIQLGASFYHFLPLT